MHLHSRYDAFGTKIDGTGAVDNKYLFAGEQYDSNLGDYYLRQRYYDTSTGRFTRRDTYEGRLVEPLTLHKYLYADSNPISKIDPSGFLSINIASITAALQGFTTLQGINMGINLASYGIDIATGNAAGLATNVIADVGALLLGPGVATGKNVQKGVIVLGKFFSRGKQFKLGVKADSTVLAHNLTEFGFKNVPGGAAHHIVPGTETYGAAQQARQILAGHGIDINSPINGIFMAGRNTPQKFVQNGSRHTGSHLYAYYDAVLAKLNSYGAATSKQGAYNALLSLRDDLRTGVLKVNSK